MTEQVKEIETALMTMTEERKDPETAIIADSTPTPYWPIPPPYVRRRFDALNSFEKMQRMMEAPPVASTCQDRYMKPKSPEAIKQEFIQVSLDQRTLNLCHLKHYLFKKFCSSYSNKT